MSDKWNEWMSMSVDEDTFRRTASEIARGARRMSIPTDRDDADVVVHRMWAEIERLRTENAELRAGWCIAYAGSHGYYDDGELQDNRNPMIDFRRDSVDLIRSKMRQRDDAALAAGKEGG